MNVENNLQEIESYMFHDALLEKLLADYKQEMEDSGFSIVEREYEEGEDALQKLLTAAQSSNLSKAEKLCRENTKWMMQFGFSKGLYAAFHQFYKDKTPEEPFETFAAGQIRTVPNMTQYTEYYEKRKTTNAIFSELEAQLGEKDVENLVSVTTAWENRLYGVLRHAFYAGYQYAISIIANTAPLQETYKMTDRIRMTEKDLGFLEL